MSFAYRNGVLCAEEVPLEEIARRYGTPCYVYSRAAIASAYGEFAAALDAPQVRERLVGFGLGVPERRQNTVAALKKHIDDFQAAYEKLITELGIEAQ